MPTLKTGDKVEIRHAGTTVEGLIVLASTNGKSLMLSFDAILDGHVGMMPVLQEDDGTYLSIITGKEVLLRKVS